MLPDELLSLIFVFATSHEFEGTRHAVWLSHVSRRFRNVALGAVDLWTELHSNASKEELETMICRSRSDSDLHVVIHSSASHSTEGINSFVDACLPTAPRWATLKVSSDIEENHGTVDSNLVRVFGGLRLDLPRLREFHIKQYRSGKISWMTYRFIPSWTAPNLRAMQCVEYIPRPSLTYSSITSFSIAFSNRYPRLINDLYVFSRLTTEHHRSRFDHLYHLCARLATIGA